MPDLGTFDAILAEVGKALLPLKLALTSPEDFYAFLLRMGWRPPAIPEPLQDIGQGLEVLFAELQSVLGKGVSADGSVGVSSSSGAAGPSNSDLLKLKNAVLQIHSGIQQLASAPDAVFPSSLIADDFKNKFPEQLVSYLIHNYLTTYYPNWGFALRALGVIKAKYVPAAGNRPPYINYSLDLSDLPSVLSNPSLVLQNAFGWGTPDFDFGAFSAQVNNLLISAGVDTFFELMQNLDAAQIDPSLGQPDSPATQALRFVFFERMRASGRMAAEVNLIPLPATGSMLPGMALLPAFNGMLNFTMQLSPDLAATISSDLNLQGGVGLFVRPQQPVQMVLGFNSGPATFAKGSISLEIDRSQQTGTPVLLFGSPNSTRLEYQKIGGSAGVRLDASGTVDAFSEFDVGGLKFVLNPSDGDGFIQYIIPGDGITVAFDLAAGISTQHGFYFRGTSELEINVPTHVQLGPLDIQSLTVTIKIQPGSLPVSLGASFDADLGPLTATVDNIGLTGTFSFPSTGGNLGPLDLQLGFKPPNGIGLAVDAGVIAGGGYLYIDTDHGEYNGILQLTIADFVSVTAIGLITTKMPDGSSGFSLLIIITADFGAGFQLGFGFTLNAVGGLLGLNRAMLMQPLMDAVRTGAIESVMFPQNVIANATRIISDLRALFPPQEGTFLVGPMAKIGWGEPTIVSVSLGVVVEIPPGNIAILGVLKLALPTEDEPIILLQVNFAGALELDKQRFFFYAVLYDSHVLLLTLEGSMGALLAWGDDANFVVSVGGFHPQYNPPPLPFPTPTAIEIDIVNESFARVRCQGYFALTSNTVQFGAQSDCYFGFSAFNIQGSGGFDALIQFSPFQFVVSISISFSVNVFGVGMFGVGMSLTVTGPTPWHFHGTASISFLFFSIDIGVDFTFGDSTNTMLPPVQVMPVLAGEFAKLSNWRAVLPAGSNLLVSLRKLDASDASLVLHPVGILKISQRSVPLELTLDKVGNQAPADANRFTLALASAGLAVLDTATEQFATAQYENMSDAAKLSAQAYTNLPSGLELSSADNLYGSATAVVRNIRYDLTVIDTEFRRNSKPFFRSPASLFTHLLAGSVVSRSPLSAYVGAQMQPIQDKVVVSGESFTVVNVADNTIFHPAAATFASQIAANDFLNRTIANDPGLAGTIQVVPQFEMAA